MPYVGNLTTVRDKESCYKDYQLVQETAKYYSSLQNVWTAMHAEAYVSQLLLEAPRATMSVVAHQLAVVTGVTMNSVGYHVAQELALQAGMHVVLMARSEGQLRRCAAEIRAEAMQRGLVDKNGIAIPITLYGCKFHLASLESVKQAAEYVTSLAHHEQYQGKLHILVNHASVGSPHAKLTMDKMEYNTACNFVAAHYFTQLLIPLLQKAARGSEFPVYKPRVIFTASMGHALGTNFHPHRLVQHPKEGGAPPGYIIVVDENTICEYEPPPIEPDNEPIEDQQQVQDDDNNNSSTSSPIAAHDAAVAMSRPISSMSTMASSLFQTAKTAIAKQTSNTSAAPATATRAAVVATSGTPVGRSKMKDENTTIRECKYEPPPSLSLVVEPVDNDDDGKEQVQDDDISSSSSSNVSPIAAHDAAAAAAAMPMAILSTMTNRLYQMTKDAIATHESNAAAAAATKAAIATGAGTQVGRSKMALVADAVYFAHLYPEINFTSHHPGAIFLNTTATSSSSSPVSVISEIFNQGIMCMVRLSPSQGARAALRAALDPDFNQNDFFDLQHGAYLHADGNPWTYMSPSASVLNPNTRQPYHNMLEFGKVCHDAANALIAQIMSTKQLQQGNVTSMVPWPAAVNVNCDEEQMDETAVKSTTCSIAGKSNTILTVDSKPGEKKDTKQ